MLGVLWKEKCVDTYSFRKTYEGTLLPIKASVQFHGDAVNYRELKKIWKFCIIEDVKTAEDVLKIRISARRFCFLCSRTKRLSTDRVKPDIWMISYV